MLKSSSLFVVSSPLQSQSFTRQTDQIDHDLDYADQIDHDLDYADQIDHDLDHLHPTLPW